MAIRHLKKRSDTTSSAAMARAERWKEENCEAIESYNQWVRKNGLPLAKFRLF